MERGIDFYINGIEKAGIEALKTVVGTYAGDVIVYGGQLDATDGKELRKALAELTPRSPLFMLSYAGGEDTWEQPVSPVPGSPWFIRHDCFFVVVVVDEDLRGEDAQRAGIYRMIADSHRALSGRLFVAVINEGEEDEERVVLNSGEFKHTQEERIAHLSNAAAYAIPFSTYFTYMSPDRSDPAQEIDNIEFGINLTNEAHTVSHDAPGVHLDIKE
jgi:hypothetical protein